MRVHGTHLNSAATNLYAAVDAEKAAAAKQAAEVRKKLKTGASEIEAKLDADAAVTISGISGESDQGSGHRQDKSNRSPRKNKQHSDEEPSSGPISMWG